MYLKHLLPFLGFVILSFQSALAQNLRLVFPQIALGDQWTSTLDLTNKGSTAFLGDVFVVGDNGLSLPVSINGTSASARYALDVPAGAVQRLAIRQSGPTVSGQLVIVDRQALNERNYNEQIDGSLVLQFRDGDRLLDSFGVSPSSILEHFQFLAENSDQIFTGLAVVEPFGAKATLNLKARSETGQTVATTQVELKAYNHQAFFINQKLSIPQGFRGTIEVVASEPIAALVIRMEGNQFSTMAVLPYVAVYDFTISLVGGRIFKGVLTFSDDTDVLKGFIRFTDPRPDASSDVDLPLLGAGDSTWFQASTTAVFSNLGIGTVYVYLLGTNGMGSTTGVCTCNDKISAVVAWSQSSASLTGGTFSATRRQ